MATKPNIVERLERKFQNASVKKNSIEAISWFRREATRIGANRINKTRLMESYDKVTRVNQGELYMYWYDPKWKATLPEYDRFPLVFVLELYDDGFLGLNLHYLPPKVRQIVLLQFAGTTNFDKHKAKRINYSVSQVILNDEYLKAMVKRYLWSHFESPVYRVPENDWDKVVFLPLAAFEKKSKRQVWRGLS